MLRRSTLGLERYGDGSHTVKRRSVAQLSVFVFAPAIALAVRAHAAGVSVARADRNEIKSAGNWNGNGAIRLRAIAEPALSVRAPTIGAAGSGDPTGKQYARTHGSKDVP